MATSGTRTFSLDVATAIEDAYELAGLEARTSYDAITARRSLNLLFADWSNRGIQMWEVTKVEQTLTKGDEIYTLNQSSSNCEKTTPFVCFGSGLSCLIETI